MSGKGTGRASGLGGGEMNAPAPAPTYLIGKLRENCITLFGVTSSTFDGAFCGCAESEMSIEDAKARIADWLGKEAR